MTEQKVIQQQETVLEERLRHGDKEALAELFSLSHERLAKIIDFRLHHQLRGRIESSDVLQEAFMAAQKRLGHFQNEFEGSVFVWLRLIVSQTLTDLERFHLGAQKRDAGKEFVRQKNATSKTMTLHLFGQVTSPSQYVIQQDMLDRVEQAIVAMEESDQEILALRHFEELTNKEAAEVIGITQKTSSIRYFRALKRLQEILSQYSAFIGGGLHAR